jgi:hypothetical protein
MMEQRMTEKHIIVTQIVTVAVDETKFTPEFMADFRKTMYPFQTLDDHLEHLAQLYARGLHDTAMRNTFIEGYGPADGMGIRARIQHVETEIDC